MPREIRLSGTEISVLKAIGLSGTQIAGGVLLGKIEDAEHVEFLDTLTGLIDRGYVVSNKVSIRRIEDVQTASFQVSATYARDLRDAMNPTRKRDEERARRQRRR
jgi:hypothetical protein